MRYALFLVRQVSRTVWKRVSRRVPHLLFHLSEDERWAMERRLRGREDFRKLRLADCVVVSFGKSGRTWLRVMLSRVYQLKHGLDRRYIIGFDNLYYKNRTIPKVLFTHDNYLKDFTGHKDSKEDFYGKKVILLVRDPRDVAVSQFFQWNHRMKPNKKAINRYPLEEMSMFDFVARSDAGLARVIGFMNLWAQEMPRLREVLVVRYEDLKSHTAETLARVMEFLGTPGTDEEIREAVEFASYENMKKMETQQTFRLSGGRLVPRDKSDPNSYKVRRAKVGGYRDYFDDEQVAEIDGQVQKNLAPEFGYTELAKESPPAEPVSAVS